MGTSEGSIVKRYSHSLRATLFLSVGILSFFLYLRYFTVSEAFRPLKYALGFREEVVARDAKGHRKSVVHYVDGILEGEFVNYRTDGSVEERGNYVNGRNEGEDLEYFPSGRIAKRSHYEGNRINGEVTEYSEDGTVNRVSTFANGLEDGDYSALLPDNTRELGTATENQVTATVTLAGTKVSSMTGSLIYSFIRSYDKTFRSVQETRTYPDGQRVKYDFSTQTEGRFVETFDQKGILAELRLFKWNNDIGPFDALESTNYDMCFHRELDGRYSYRTKSDGPILDYYQLQKDGSFSKLQQH